MTADNGTTQIRSLLDIGDTVRAVELCRASLAVEATATVENLLGRALARMRDFDGAKAAFERAIALAPTDPTPLANLGNLLRDRGSPNEAMSYLERSLTLRPDSARTLATLGAALNDTGGYARARVVLERALALEPGLEAAMVRLARAVATLDGREAAIELLSEAVRERPASSTVRGELGTLLTAAGRRDEAKEHLEVAYAASPRSAQICAKLGENLRARGETRRARELLEGALSLDPELGEAHLALALLFAELGEGSESDRHLELARRARAVTDEANAAWLFLLLHRESATPAMIRSAHEELGARLERETPPARSLPSRPLRRPLRIGYVSADFRAHVIALFTEKLIGAHDRSRVEIELISSTSRRDEVTARFERLAPFHDLEGCSTTDFVTRVRGLDLDLVVDLSGYSDGHRQAALAKRIAPVQASYLGYPATTGLRAMDFRITDALSDPPGTESEFVEKLYRLPEVGWAYSPSVVVAEPRVPGERGDNLVFGCFNRKSKLTRGMLAAWRSILEQRPGARLLLKSRGFEHAEARKRVEDALGDGVARRVTFRPWTLSARSVYEAYDEVDVALDTWPYNGTTTTCDAMWMGVGVITLRGDTAPSRVGNALLSTVGLEDLVAHDLDGYVRAALALAADADRRRRLRRELRGALIASPLGNPLRLARQLEDAFESMCNLPAR